MSAQTQLPRKSACGKNRLEPVEPAVTCPRRTGRCEGSSSFSVCPGAPGRCGPCPSLGPAPRVACASHQGQAEGLGAPWPYAPRPVASRPHRLRVFWSQGPVSMRIPRPASLNLCHHNKLSLETFSPSAGISEVRTVRPSNFPTAREADSAVPRSQMKEQSTEKPSTSPDITAPECSRGSP